MEKSKKLLFIVSSFNTPPKQGVELVNTYYLDYFRKYFDVDLLIMPFGEEFEQQKLEAKKINSDISVFVVPENQISGKKKVWEELTLVAPTFFNRGIDEESLEKIDANNYDWVWCGDERSIGFVQFAKKLGYLNFSKVAVSISEASSVIYGYTFLEVLKGKRKFTKETLSHGIRFPLVRLHEKLFFQDVQFIHVQTELEKKRVENIIGKSTSKKPLIVAAPNGKNTTLQEVDYVGGDGSVLYFAQVTGPRAAESEWFLKKVWPKIFAQHPESKLYIAGTGSTTVSEGIPMDGVVLCGFVENMADLYQRASVAVVPTFRGTGLINRVVDAIAAKCPLVATREVMETVNGLEFGIHALEARTEDEFVSTISTLLSDKEMRMKLSEQASELAAILPTWDESGQCIVDALQLYK